MGGFFPQIENHFRCHKMLYYFFLYVKFSKYYYLSGPRTCTTAFWDISVPKVSSSPAVAVVIFPLTPEILYKRSPEKVNKQLIIKSKQIKQKCKQIYPTVAQTHTGFSNCHQKHLFLILARVKSLQCQHKPKQFWNHKKILRLLIFFLVKSHNVRNLQTLVRLCKLYHERIHFRQPMLEESDL